MIKLLTSGGLGDAAMSFAKIHAKFSMRDDIHVTHVRTRSDNLNDAISSFYSSQNIRNNVVTTVSWDWLKDHRSEYGYYLGTNWSKENHNDESSWEIEPFPPICYNKMENVNVVLNPCSGGGAEKRFSHEEVDMFMRNNPETILVGVGDSVYENYPNSKFNKTTMEELIDILSSSNVVVSPEGFVSYFSAMCGKKVFVKNENVEAIKKRKHPMWDMTLIDGLDYESSIDSI